MSFSRRLREKYDALFLDCPSGISLLSESVLRAADAVIVPILPTPLSVRMLIQLDEFISQEGWSDMFVLPFFSMVDRRKSLHHAMIESTRAVSCHPRHRDQIRERDRAHEPAPGAAARLRTRERRGADVLGAVERDRRSHRNDELARRART